jgi:hypothetical protein
VLAVREGPVGLLPIGRVGVTTGFYYACMQQTQKATAALDPDFHLCTYYFLE